MRQESSTRPPCTTCGRDWAPDAFYAGRADCKDCKRAASRANRDLNARKVEVLEQLLEALTTREVSILLRPTDSNAA